MSRKPMERAENWKDDLEKIRDKFSGLEPTTAAGPVITTKLPVVEKKEKSIVIGCPHMGTFPWQFVYSALSLRPQYPATWRMVGSSLVYHAREEICQFAIQGGHDYVFFIDSDMEFPGNIIDRFIAYDKPVVGAMAFKRVEPFEPCFYDEINIMKDTVQLKPITEYGRGLVEAKGIGMACCLIKTEILKDIEMPYFFPHPKLGEDLAFCKKVTDAGNKIYVDTDFCAGHIGSFAITDKNYKAYQAFQQQQKEQPK